MQIIYLNNILNLKIEITLGLIIRYNLERAYNINYALYKSLKTILYRLHSA